MEKIVTDLILFNEIYIYIRGHTRIPHSIHTFTFHFQLFVWGKDETINVFEKVEDLRRLFGIMEWEQEQLEMNHMRFRFLTSRKKNERKKETSKHSNSIFLFCDLSICGIFILSCYPFLYISYSLWFESKVSGIDLVVLDGYWKGILVSRSFRVTFSFSKARLLV